METNTPTQSDLFLQLYCNAAVYDGFSALHPVSFSRVLPFQAHDPVMDDPHLLNAEVMHLNNPNDATRLAVVENFVRCRLLSTTEFAGVKQIIDYFDADFFEFMGEVYANAGMSICALRWYREYIAELETRRPDAVSDNEGVYASVGYGLYSLGLYPESIVWSKSCIGPRQTADTVSRVLIDYEAQLHGGCIERIERAASRARYTVSALDPAQARELSPRLKNALSTFAPFQETYIDWAGSDSRTPDIQAEGYPFQTEREAGDLTRHRMNLIFALCGHADDLVSRSYHAEARRVLIEATLLEPKAEFIWERLKAIA